MPRSIQHPRATVRPLIEGLGALVVLVCGLVGIPLVLATTVGWPLPHHLSGGGQVADALRSTIPDSFWPHLFASLAWIAWAYFVFSVLATAISRVRTPSGHRRRPLGRHSAAAGLVSAVITAAVVLSQLRGAPTGRIPAPTSVATAPFRSAVASPPSTSSVVEARAATRVGQHAIARCADRQGDAHRRSRGHLVGHCRDVLRQRRAVGGHLSGQRGRAPARWPSPQ